MEPPTIPEGYGISVAYGSLLDIVRSISLAIQGPSKLGEENAIPYKDRVSEEDRALHAQLITSSWCGLLAALTPLIDAATDESATENVLKAMQNYAALCGTLGLACFMKCNTAMTVVFKICGIFSFRFACTTRCIYCRYLQILITSTLCAVRTKHGLSIIITIAKQ